MNKETIEKLHDLEHLRRNAIWMITNGNVDERSINYLLRFDTDFKNDLYDLWEKYRNKYEKLIEEL